MSYEKDHWVICDVCDIKIRASESKVMWNNLVVCKYDYDRRHPQDYLVRGRNDRQMVEDSRTRPTDVFGTGSAADL